VLVVRVAEGSPAQAGGIRRGDLIVAVDGKPVESLESLYKGIWAHARTDDEIRITLPRGEDAQTLTMRAVDRMMLMAKPSGI
jgi:serine protease Do